MSVRTVRFEIPMLGYPWGSVVTVDDTVPLVAALIAAGKMTPYTPPVGSPHVVDGNSLVRVGDLQDSASDASAALRAASDAAFGLHLPPWYLSQNNSFRQIPVVMMHNFTDSANALGTLKDYAAWGYQSIFFSELMTYLATGDASHLPAKPIVFCDDDGGASAYTYLYPAMQSLGYKVSFFLVPDWLDGTITAPPNGGTFLEASPMTWANCVEMKASGLAEFQSHTKTHGSMRLISGVGTFSANEDGSGAGADYLYCKQRIEAMIPGANVQYNAAPYGVINETAIASLKAAGCKGNRITQCGQDYLGDYDGSGPSAYTYPTTDPFRVPIADGGNFKYIRRQNVYGTADADGNMFQNGKFLVSSRGITLPTGWAFQSGVTLPDGTTGTVLQGSGTAAATGATHTDTIPVGFYGAYTIDWWVKCASAPTASVRIALDTFVNPKDTTPVSTITEVGPVGGTTGWTSKRFYVLGDATYAWVKPRFEIVGATTGAVGQWWNVRVCRTRAAWHSGI